MALKSSPAGLQKALPSNVCLDPRSYSHVLAGVQVDENTIRYGLTDASINYKQSMEKMGRFAGPCSSVSTP